MTDGPMVDDEATKAELKEELRQTRSKLHAMETELTQTNEGMVALTVELENAKERYQTIFEEATDGILLIDPEENSIYEANPQVSDLLGYDRETLLNLTPADIFSYDNAQTLSFAEAVVKGWTSGFTCRTSTGRKIDVEISASVITLDNKSLLLASLRDVTEHNRNKQRLQVLTRIFRHNLRNDGNVIHGYADMIEDQVSTPELQERARLIKRTINKILRMSSKVQHPHFFDQNAIEVTPLNVVLDNQREWFEGTYPEITLELNRCTAEPLVARRLSVAAKEILENAAEHAHGTSKVSITTDYDIAEDQVNLIFEDDGPGIPDDELEAIRRGQESPLTHTSGIGLWVVYWVVESLGGEWEIQTKGDLGTRVSIRLPGESGSSTHELLEEKSVV